MAKQRKREAGSTTRLVSRRKLKDYVDPRGGSFSITSGSGTVEAVLMLLQETGLFGTERDEVVDRILCEWILKNEERLEGLGISLAEICEQHRKVFRRVEEGAEARA